MWNRDDGCTDHHDDIGGADHYNSGADNDHYEVAGPDNDHDSPWLVRSTRNDNHHACRTPLRGAWVSCGCVSDSAATADNRY